MRFSNAHFPGGGLKVEKLTKRGRGVSRTAHAARPKQLLTLAITTATLGGDAGVLLEQGLQTLCDRIESAADAESRYLLGFGRVVECRLTGSLLSSPYLIPQLPQYKLGYWSSRSSNVQGGSYNSTTELKLRVSCANRFNMAEYS